LVTAQYRHLGPFSDLVGRLREVRPLFPRLGRASSDRLRLLETIRFTLESEQPRDVQLGEKWRSDGCIGEPVSWSVGYGPRTEGWLLRPEGTSSPLPGVLALHDHGAFKFFGKEKIANGPSGPSADLSGFRDTYYAGRPFANALARQGFAVLVHDVFLWGSRRFPLDVMPERERKWAELFNREFRDASLADEIGLYNVAAMLHENTVEKYCAALGTTLGAIVSYEDRVAANYLASRPDVIGQRIGCVGLSGGGCRAAMLQATSERISASVIAGMMSTHEDMLDQHVANHTWMFFPRGLSQFGDWPDLAASAAPKGLLVQYLLDDELFPSMGVTNADAIIKAYYRDAGCANRYVGQFFPGAHRFDLEMQGAAFDWLAAQLGGAEEAHHTETN
jgi:dienelactone hydrolase